MDKKGNLVEPDPQEINILYVAMTRAMRGLELPGKVYEWLARSGKTHILKQAQQSKTLEAKQAPEQPHPELVDWFGKMEEYFQKVSTHHANTPEKAAQVAKYLTKKANEIANNFRG